MMLVLMIELAAILGRFMDLPPCYVMPPDPIAKPPLQPMFDQLTPAPLLFVLADMTGLTLICQYFTYPSNQALCSTIQKPISL